MNPSHDISLRAATAADLPRLEALIAASVRGLSAGFYSPVQIEGALRHVFGVDSQLIADGSYYMIEAGGELAAAGGWSARRTLYGGDQAKETADPRLDPATDAARIRAFFVHPSWARQGLARRLYARAEEDARAAGFRAFTLVATRPGEPLYTALGFRAEAGVEVPLPGGATLPCVRMVRPIAGPSATPAAPARPV